MPENMLIRHGEPSKYDYSPFGTICKCIKTLNDEFEIYVQMSNDEESPQWERLGIFSSSSEHTIQEEVNKMIGLNK